MLAGHRQMIKQLRGVPGVTSEKMVEGNYRNSYSRGDSMILTFHRTRQRAWSMLHMLYRILYRSLLTGCWSTMKCLNH